jgi:hypothetical protein
MSDETGISSADTSTEAVVDETDPPTVKEIPPSRSVTPAPQQPTTVAIIAPSDDGSNASEVEAISTVTNADDALTPRRGVSHIRPRPHTFRPVVLRPPPRRVTQKKSYESIESLASFKREPKTTSALSPRSNREIILTPVESIDSMRSSEEGKLRKESRHHSEDRPASVISTTTVAFGV